MIKSGYFELGTVVVLENEDSFADCKEKLDRTIGSLVSQTFKPVRVGIVAINCGIKIKDIKGYIDKISKKLYESGIYNLDFTKCLEKVDTFRKVLANEYLGFISKPMSIVIHDEKKGNKKSKLRVSHFSVISAGSTYNENSYYEKIKSDFISGKKALIIYSNFIAQDGEKIIVNPSDLTDKFPVTYFAHGFKHFVIGGGDGFIMDIYRCINKERRKIKREDDYLNDIDDGSYNDFVFLKSKGSIVL